MQVPGFLARRFYVAGSLRNTPTGFRFRPRTRWARALWSASVGSTWTAGHPGRGGLRCPRRRCDATPCQRGVATRSHPRRRRRSHHALRRGQDAGAGQASTRGRAVRGQHGSTALLDQRQPGRRRLSARGWPDRVVVIAHPGAGRGASRASGRPGRGARRPAGGLRRAAHHAGHGGRRIRAPAADAARSLVLAVGGDGTLHEVVNGLLHDDGSGTPRPADDLPALGLVPAGRGSDYARGLHIRATRPCRRTASRRSSPATPRQRAAWTSARRPIGRRPWWPGGRPRSHRSQMPLVPDAARRPGPRAPSPVLHQWRGGRLLALRRPAHGPLPAAPRRLPLHSGVAADHRRLARPEPSAAMGRWSEETRAVESIELALGGYEGGACTWRPTPTRRTASSMPCSSMRRRAGSW